MIKDIEWWNDEGFNNPKVICGSCVMQTCKTGVINTTTKSWIIYEYMLYKVNQMAQACLTSVLALLVNQTYDFVIFD